MDKNSYENFVLPTKYLSFKYKYFHLEKKEKKRKRNKYTDQYRTDERSLQVILASTKESSRNVL